MQETLLKMREKHEASERHTTSGSSDNNGYSTLDSSEFDDDMTEECNCDQALRLKQELADMTFAYKALTYHTERLESAIINLRLNKDAENAENKSTS